MTHTNSPTFNLKAVVQETGLKPDTLRAWERRYGLPNPQRTDGGHRLYSQQDISTLKWLVQRQQEGLSISRAVEMWRQLEAEGRNPLQVDLEGPASPPNRAAFSGVDTLTTLRQAWVQATMDYDEQRAEHILAQTFALFSIERACHDLIQKGLAELGEGWRRGLVTVQQEHFASNLVARWLEALVAATPSATHPGRVLIGCPGGEEHVMMSLMLTLALRRRNRDVLYLGANIPAAQMVSTIKRAKTELVVLSAQSLPTASTLFETAQILQREEIPLAFGGRIFSQVVNLRHRIAGHFLGEDLTEACEAVEALLNVPRRPKPHKKVTKLYQDAYTHYAERQASLETTVWQTLPPHEPFYALLPVANHYLASHIKASLKLGDVRFLNSDLKWFLIKSPIDFEALNRYLTMYHQAAQQNLDERGQLVIEWLAEAVR